MKNEDYVVTVKWFAWYPVKTTNSGWVWWKYVDRTTDERPEVYMGLLTEYTYKL